MKGVACEYARLQVHCLLVCGCNSEVFSLNTRSGNRMWFENLLFVLEIL